jgi:hypothetical protein
MNLGLPQTAQRSKGGGKTLSELISPMREITNANKIPK